MLKLRAIFHSLGTFIEFYARLERFTCMSHRRVFSFAFSGAAIRTGVAVLGMALSVPAVLLAQSSTPPDAAATAPQSDAQPGMAGRHHHPPSAERQLRHMTKALNLTADQQQQILPILQDRNQQMKALHDNTSLSPQDRRDQARSIMQNTHQKIEAVLNDTQKQQFEQMMQQRRDHWKNGRNGAPGAGPGDAGTPPPPPDGQAPPAEGQTPPPPPQA